MTKKDLNFDLTKDTQSSNVPVINSLVKSDHIIMGGNTVNATSIGLIFKSLAMAVPTEILYMTYHGLKNNAVIKGDTLTFNSFYNTTGQQETVQT